MTKKYLSSLILTQSYNPTAIYKIQDHSSTTQGRYTTHPERTSSTPPFGSTYVIHTGLSRNHDNLNAILNNTVIPGQALHSSKFLWGGHVRVGQIYTIKETWNTEQLLDHHSPITSQAKQICPPSLTSTTQITIAILTIPGIRMHWENQGPEFIDPS